MDLTTIDSTRGLSMRHLEQHVNSQWKFSDTCYLKVRKQCSGCGQRLKDKNKNTVVILNYLKHEGHNKTFNSKMLSKAEVTLQFRLTHKIWICEGFCFVFLLPFAEVTIFPRRERNCPLVYGKQMSTIYGLWLKTNTSMEFNTHHRPLECPPLRMCVSLSSCQYIYINGRVKNCTKDDQYCFHSRLWCRVSSSW